jgi:hypothetical protein
MWDVELKLPSKPRILIIPSRECADRITNTLLSNQEVTHSAAIFLHGLSIYRDENQKDLMKKVGQKPRDFQLIEELLKVDNNAQVSTTINTYWHNYWTTTEELRWSNEPKLAYINLRQRLLAKTIEEIQVSSEWPILEEKDFPRLPKMDEKCLEDLLSNMATNKAIALDGLSDNLFKATVRKKTAKIFKNLWTIDLDKIQGIQASLTSSQTSAIK